MVSITTLSSKVVWILGTFQFRGDLIGDCFLVSPIHCCWVPAGTSGQNVPVIHTCLGFYYSYIKCMAKQIKVTTGFL